MHPSRHGKSELQKYVSLLHSCTKSLRAKLDVPDELLSGASWRFPEKLARDIDVDYFLALDGADEKLKLELIVDRFVLLLQTCLLIFDKNSPLPLTLASTVKKFVRTLNNQQTRHKERLKQTSTSTISSSTTTIETLRQDSTSCTTTSTIGDSLQQASTASIVDNATLMPSAVHVDDAELRVTNGLVDVSVQTLETSLAACSSCASLRHTLNEYGQKVATLCSSLQLPSQVQSVMTDWKLFMTADKTKFSSAIEEDLSAIKQAYENLQAQCDAKNNLLEELQARCDTLMQHVESLQHDLECTKKQSKMAIQDTEQKLVFEIDEYKNELSKEILKNDMLKQEICHLKIEENNLRLIKIQKDNELKSIAESLKQSRCNEAQLQKLKSQLEEQLVSAEQEREKVSKILEEKDIELRKTMSRLCNLETRYKTIQTKHNSLLMHVDELDQQCDKLGGELIRTKQEKSDIKSELARVTGSVNEIQHELEREQKISATIENDKIILQSSLAQMEQDLKEQQKLLEEEKDNSKKLLMEYDLSLGSKVQSISDSRKAINANSIRIMLLEEQNKKLRQIAIDNIPEENKCFEVTKPVQLWQSHVLPQDLYSSHSYHNISSSAHSFDCDATRKTKSQPVASDNTKIHPTSALFRTATSSHSSLPLHSCSQTPPISPLSSASSYQKFQTFSCTECDRMFCSRLELHDHCKSSCYY